MNCAGTIGVLGLLATITWSASAALGDEPRGPAAAAKSVKPAHPSFTPEREAAAVTFVTMNHPELADLLAQLKSTRRKEYEAAVRDLYRVCERMAQIKDRDPERHSLELSAWKVRSQVQLLAARGSMSDSKTIESELRTLLAKQQELQLAQLKLERRRAQQRLQKAEQALAQFERNRAAQLDNQVQAALRNIERSRAAVEQRRAKRPGKAAASAEGGESAK